MSEIFCAEKGHWIKRGLVMRKLCASIESRTKHLLWTLRMPSEVLLCLRQRFGEREQAKSLWQEARSLYQSEDVQAGVRESDAQIELLSRN
jgi:hypothetical protein